MISVPVILITLLCFLMPSRNSASSIESSPRKFAPNPKIRGYAVIFDAESLGSRVHGFCFDKQLDLIPIGKELELFVQATAGLRQLDGDTPDMILQAVRDLLKNRGTFKSKADWVTVLDGNQEGAYQWEIWVKNIHLPLEWLILEVAMYKWHMSSLMLMLQRLLGYQMERILMCRKCISRRITSWNSIPWNTSPPIYLHYGLLAARAEILKVGKSGNLCILSGYNCSYKYGGEEYDASAVLSGSTLNACREAANKALKINEPTCTHMKCTFGGVWNGRGGDDACKSSANSKYSSFTACLAGFVDPKKAVAKVRRAAFEAAAKIACQKKLADAKSRYPPVDPDNLPYLCMDLVYQYTLLIDGFGLDPEQEITLVKKVEYQNSLVEAAWPLGSAIEVMSLKT